MMKTAILSPSHLLRWEPSDILRKKFNLVSRSREGLITKEIILASLCRNGKSPAEAIASAEEKEYTIKKWRFFRSIIQVMETEKNREAGKLKMDSIGAGVLQLRNGNQYSWALLNFWKSEWGFMNGKGKTICTFHSTSLLLEDGVEVGISENYKEHEDLPLLMIVGWYALLMISEEGIFILKTSVQLDNLKVSA